jgi:hypothetical protein
VAHHSIYQRLTSDPNDAIGLFAYIVYKRQKLEFCRSFGGRELTREELANFYAVAMLDTSIEVYRARGETMMRAFLNLGLDEFVANTEAATRQRVFYQMIESGNLALESKITAVNDSLRERRTVGGWVRDVSANLVVNLVTIFILGALLLGYRFSAELQQGVEKKTGIGGPIASEKQTTIERSKPTGPATTTSSTNP